MTAIFKLWYSSYEDVLSDEGTKVLKIHLAGRTRDNKSVQVIVEEFRPYVYVELPTRIKDWTKYKIELLFEYFCTRYKNRKPTGYKLVTVKKLHYNVSVKCIYLEFSSNEAAKSFSYDVSKVHYVDGIGKIYAKEFVPHEFNIDPIIKFSTVRNIKLAGWVEVPINKDVEKFSMAEIESRVHWEDVRQYETNEVWTATPKYMCFDIECYSVNHNSKLPNPNEVGNEVIQIGTIVGTLGDVHNRKNVLFTLGDPHDIKGVEVRRYSTERDLILDFFSYINKEDVDCIMGYNIIKFDWDYLLGRIHTHYPKDFARVCLISRLLEIKANVVTMKWESSAYGEQEFRFLDPHGRINLDVFIEIVRNYKFANYNLNTVAEFFLKRTKKDLSAMQIFMLYKLWKELSEISLEGVIPKADRICIKQKIMEILPQRKSYGVVGELRSELLSFTTGEELRELIRKTMTIIGEYCMVDVELPIDIAEKIKLWTTMEELSNCMNVPMSYLHNRGQQIKVLAQMYRSITKNGYIIPHHEKKNKTEKYTGAIVIESIPGFYTNVANLDFESLYPSIVIAYNICYTTIVRDDDPIDDNECNILEWEEHMFCEHDERGVKKKPTNTIVCRKYRYRFRKIKIQDDGTILNEGILPRLERNLLSERKLRKKELATVEAILRMDDGKATDKDIEYYNKIGLSIIQKGSIPKDKRIEYEILHTVKNAQQLALKVSANSAYGALGAQNGIIPFIEGARCVTAMGRKLIMAAVRYILKDFSSARNIESKLVYGDTDSSMIMFPGGSVAETSDISADAAKETSHYLRCSKFLFIDPEYSITYDGVKYRIDKFPRKNIDKLSVDDKRLVIGYDLNPINLQLECIYGKFLLLSKKRYLTWVVNRNGEIIDKIDKGVVTKRRDNCQFLRDTYKLIKEAIFEYKTEYDIQQIIYDRINKLFTRGIPETHLISYVGVKDIIRYAKSIKEKSTISFIDKTGAIFTPIDNLDSRLVYPNLPQVLLSLKMIRRGDDVPPNTRLEYIHLDTGVVNEHLGDSAEDYTYYRENKIQLNLKVDLFHYIGTQFTNAITELVSVAFPHQRVSYVKLENEYKYRLSLLTDLQFANVKRQRKYVKALTFSIDNNKKIIRTYQFAGIEAQLSYIFDSVKRYVNKLGDGYRNEIDPENNKELLDVCRKLKSRLVIDRYCVYYRSPKVRSRNHMALKNIVFVKDYTHNGITASAGEFGDIIEKSADDTLKIVLNRSSDQGDTSERRVVIEKVPKDMTARWYIKDGELIEDVYKMRKKYKEVVKMIKDISNRVDEVEDVNDAPDSYTFTETEDVIDLDE